ncbi:hypothetical protein BKA64DRAFT_707201 [Cadophora sp. MPI-SDFR-AT-0126]|nr:hypothetical protein BKA64DRAFT_707201 [Leotiomycetes sp. MPI-SDFR-AT-0126]
MASQSIHETSSIGSGEGGPMVSANNSPVHPARQTRPIPPSLNCPQPVVTIILRQKNLFTDLFMEAKFCIHKDFICYHSPFFAAAFTGHCVEGESQTMSFDDVHPPTFGVFTNWLYTQALKTRAGDNLDDIWNLTELWILAQRFLMPKLQNQIMLRLYPTLKRYSGTRSIKDLGNRASQHKSDMLKRLHLDKVAAIQCEERFNKLTEDLGPQDLLQLARLLKAKQIEGVKEMKPVKEYLLPVEAANN